MCCLQSRLADNYCSKAFILCFEFTNLGLKSYSLVCVIRPPFSAAISHASRLDSSTRYTDKNCSWPQYLQLEQYKVRWVRDCKFRRGTWLLSVKSRGHLGFVRAKWIPVVWRWWDIWVQEDSSFLESREKTGYTFMKVREKGEKEALKKKRKILCCTPGLDFMGAVGIWVRLQLFQRWGFSVVFQELKRKSGVT